MSGMIFKKIVTEKLLQYFSSEEKKAEVLTAVQDYMEVLTACAGGKKGKDYSKELLLIKNVNEENYETQLKILIDYYYDSISDRYVYTFSLFTLKALRLFFYLYGVFYRRKINELFEERISLTGDIKYLKKIVMTANPVYFCKASQQADSLFVVLALIKFISIPLPRFMVDKKLLNNSLMKFFF